MADIDEELIRKAEEKADLDQKQRLQQQQEQEETQNQPRQQVRNFVKQQATQATKKVAKSYAKKLIWSTAPYWGPVLAIVLLVGFILMFVVVGVPLIACSYSESTSGLWMKASLSSIIGVGGAANFSWDYAKAKYCPPPISYQSGGGGSGASFSINIVITSAYRPNSSGSAHQRGEAVDIAIRPSPTSNNDPRIDQLVAIAKKFFPGPAAGARGDTLDEYRNPTEQATGGHVHVEFNTYTFNGQTYTYCDDTVVKIPPTDLVDLPYPSEGITPPNQAKVRPCILDEISGIFSAAR